jgi:HlyD family secretion protein
MATSTKSKPTRWIPYILGAGLVILILLGLRPQAVTVETARVVTGPLRATVSEEGKTRIKQRYVVAAPVSGQLRRIAFKPGAGVEAGVTVVAVIDPLPASPLDGRHRALAEARRNSTRIVLEKSRTSHELARNELRRIQQMFQAGTISPQELESAQMRETTAARDVATAEGALKQVEAELQSSPGGPASPQADSPDPVEVLANASGRILHVFQESSRAVMQGTPLLEIGDPADLEVIVEMLSRDGAAIAAGAPVSLEQWGGPGPLEGRVRLVEPAAFTKYSALGVEEQRVNVVVDITSPREQWRSLGDNFRIEARVITWESSSALKVPVSGLFRRGNDWAAFVVRDGAAQLVPVKAGKSSGAEIQVVEGLQEGDEVILYPGDRIKPGQRVKPAKV